MDAFVPFPPRMLAAALLCAGLLGGCATQNLLTKDGRDESDMFAAGRPPALAQFYRQLYRDGEWNATLNFNLLGLAAMQEGDFVTARKAFDQAIARIDQIYADDPNAKKALSNFNEEKVKDFKGEPYERAMSYFYRGVLYLQEGDFQNARAAFLGADLQGTMAERERFEGDFGLMKYMAGWASTCSGDADRGRTLIREAKKSDSKISALPDKPGSAMLLIDNGLAPRKVGVGEYKEALTFQLGGEPDKNVVVRGPNGSLEIKDFLLGGDVYLQAATRGGRPVDSILDGKAQFKSNTDAVGDVAMVTGMAMMNNSYNNSNLGTAGAIVGLIGLLAKGVAAATTPAADVRMWTSLPAQEMLFTANLTPAGPVTISAPTMTERPLAIQASHKGCWIGWGRTRSALAVANGGTAELADAKVEVANREEKNKVFRTALVTEFAAPKAVVANTTPVATAQPTGAPGAK